jgi:hypothetical protein
VYAVLAQADVTGEEAVHLTFWLVVKHQNNEHMLQDFGRCMPSVYHLQVVKSNHSYITVFPLFLPFVTQALGARRFSWPYKCQRCSVSDLKQQASAPRSWQVLQSTHFALSLSAICNADSRS